MALWVVILNRCRDTGGNKMCERGGVLLERLQIARLNGKLGGTKEMNIISREFSVCGLELLRRVI